MFFKKITTLFFLLFFIATSSYAAKPSDQQVLKDISTPRMKDIKLSKSGGTYSVYGLQRWWTRGVTYTTDARIKEFPKATQLVGAEARYRIVGENYDFDKLKFVWTEYQGIPMPSDKEILSIIKGDIISFVQPYNWNRMVSELDGPHLSKDPAVRKITWHTANSFTITLQAKYSVISSNTEVQDIATDFEVRFYRDGVNKPWKKRFLSSKRNEKVVAKHKYTSDQINAMQTQATKAAEKQAKASISELPSIKIPKFSSDKEAFAFIYKILRSGDRKRVEAMYRAMTYSGNYVQGSKVRLTPRGEENLQNLLKAIFDGKVTFAESYCPQIFVKRYQTNQVEIFDALKRNKTRISLGLEGGGYNRGKKVGQLYKINALEAWTLRTDDDVAQLKSWPFDELCAENMKTTNRLSVGKPKKVSAGSSATSKSKSKSSTTSEPTTAVAIASKGAILAPPKPQVKWETFNSKYLPLSMKIIGKANEKQKTKNGKKVTVMVAQTNQGAFRLTATDFNQKITSKIATPTHVKFAKNFVKSNKALIHRKKQVNFGTGKALDYLVERGSGNKRVMISYRVFSNGTVVYQAMYSQFKKSFDKAIAQKFMDSLTLKR